MRKYGGMTAEERVAARRRRIMDAAIELFSTQGYGGTSMRAVLRHCHLPDRYFTESFASLDELLAAILEEIQQDEAARCRAALATGGTRRDRARGMLDVLAGGVVDDPRKGRIKLVESLAGGPLAAAERRRGLRRLASLVESLLREDWAAPGTDVTAMAMAVVGGVNQILLNWVDGGLAFSREDFVDQALHFFDAVAAFGAGPPPEGR
ncbi:TetR/AcrR family transcriptional regulator [Streptomyces sp. PA03-1a]|nr:TetR/AcrR family transcriptional regulator [Streptomyces sp. PA03-1a]MDX2815646.1 TetR/AcrR family transcriptional regulator [Streptomyces sp. PA03-5A]